MKKSVVKLLLATLVLATVATAADRTKGAFLTNSTEGSYWFYQIPSPISGYVDAAVYNDSTTGVRRAHLYISLEDWVSYRFLYAYGDVPVSTFKLTGTGISMKIADLRQLAGLPDFSFSESGFYGEIPLNCTISKTSVWQQNSTGKYTERVPQPDGTTTLYKTMSKWISTSAYTEGNLADYSFTSTEYYGGSSLYEGNYKSHFVP